MNCPCCNHAIPDALVLSEAAKLHVSRRARNILPSGDQLKHGGRKPVPTPCPRCKVEQPSAGAALRHCKRPYRKSSLAPAAR